MLLLLNACSPFYVIRAAYEQSKILWNREDIEKVLADKSRPEEERKKLALVLAARSFSIQMGLVPGHSYTKYTDVRKDALAWVVAGSKPDAFSLYTWWFPIVGRVPYKGYFEKKDADAEALDLEKDGYETWVRGAETLSTLGWFNDPVLSTTLKNDPIRIANTVIHETLHRTVWIPDHVDFNESLANFVGSKGAVQFFAKSALPFKDLDATACTAECSAARKLLEFSCVTLQQQLTLASGIETLYTDLDHLYRSSVSREAKLAQRAAIFDRSIAPLKARFPRMNALASINNAEIIQLKLYMTKLLAFEMLYRKEQDSWPMFLSAIKEIAKIEAKDRKKDPFILLADAVAGPVPEIDSGVCE